MIVVTGANGRLGTRIVERLLDRIPAEQIAISVRDVDRAAALAARGVRVRRGDFTEPATLADAFADADQVLVISASLIGGDAVAANTAAMDAAVTAGARRVLYTSHQAAAKDSLFAPQPVHAAGEEHLQRLGVPFTSLRNGFYVSTLALQIGDALQTGRLVAPADGPVSWTAHDDLAEAAAIALTTDGILDGITPPLTAPDMIDLERVAALLSELGGRTVTRVVVDDDEWVAAAVDRGLPEGGARFALGMFQAARNGEFAVTDPTLETVIGHPAAPARTFLQSLIA